MATVIVFDPADRPTRRPRPASGETAEILLFTGVRYERDPDRIDFAERRTPPAGGSGRRGFRQA